MVRYQPQGARGSAQQGFVQLKCPLLDTLRMLRMRFGLRLSRTRELRESIVQKSQFCEGLGELARTKNASWVVRLDLVCGSSIQT